MKKLLVLILLLSGAAFAQHAVQLTCNPSTTLGVTYNFYRGTATGGPYSIINLSPVTSCDLLDSNVLNGSSYFYVARAFDSVTLSSVSNEAKAVIPTAPAPPNGLTAIVK